MQLGVEHTDVPNHLVQTIFQRDHRGIRRAFLRVLVDVSNKSAFSERKI